MKRRWKFILLISPLIITLTHTTVSANGQLYRVGISLCHKYHCGHNAMDDILKFLESKGLNLGDVKGHPQGQRIVEDYVHLWNSMDGNAAKLAIAKRGKDAVGSSPEWLATINVEKKFLIDAAHIGFLRQAIETAARNSGRLQMNSDFRPFVKFFEDGLTHRAVMNREWSKLTGSFKNSQSGREFANKISAEYPDFAIDGAKILIQQNPYLGGQFAHTVATIAKNSDKNLIFTKDLVPTLGAIRIGQGIDVELAGAALLIGLSPAIIESILE